MVFDQKTKAAPVLIDGAQSLWAPSVCCPAAVGVCLVSLDVDFSSVTKILLIKTSPTFHLSYNYLSPSLCQQL